MCRVTVEDPVEKRSIPADSVSRHEASGEGAWIVTCKTYRLVWPLILRSDETRDTI
jgi:hypothetical protein